MATFITRGRFSQSGVQGLLAKPEDREEAVKRLVEAAGGKLVHYFVTTGDADFLLIAEGDETEMAVASAMAAAASGAVSDVTTSQAWTSAEFKAVTEKASAIVGSYKAPGQG